MTDNINAKNVTSAFVWGSQSLPENLLNPDLMRAGTSEDPTAAFTLSTPLAEYMTTGPGRFAFGTQFAIIDNFFGRGLSRFALAPGKYTKANLQERAARNKQSEEA